MESDRVTSTRPGWADPAEAGPLPAVPDQPPAQRIGRVERERADQQLRWALAEDILTIGEFDDRLGRVMQAKTHEDLDQVLGDLPRPTALPRPQTPLRPCARLVAVMGGEEKRGRWRPGRPLRLLAVMGGVVADLRDAETHDGVFDIDAVAIMGGIEIVVPDNANVDLDGFAVMGGRDNRVIPAGEADGPLVRVNGYALMGGVVIRPATKRERKRHPATETQEHVTFRSPGPTAEVPARRKSWVGRVIGMALLAGLILGPGQAVATADTRAIFGGSEYHPSDAELAGEDEVKVFSLFGGVDVVIPEGYSARRDGGLSLFGGVSCDQVCDREGDEVQVDATAIFGGVNISDGTDDEGDDDDD